MIGLNCPHVLSKAVNSAAVPFSYCVSPSDATASGASAWISVAVAPYWQALGLEVLAAGGQAMSPAAARVGLACAGQAASTAQVRPPAMSAGQLARRIRRAYVRVGRFARARQPRVELTNRRSPRRP